ncbi:hypothetical protein OHA21_16480 [Actinoplanes sp. NBC_00393]|uniref:hypothetical protein n=1 Tax=Actinoplanes sp. NBC_00393 TaxID=2975953 RepID=UPI002E222CA6
MSRTRKSASGIAQAGLVLALGAAATALLAQPASAEVSAANVPQRCCYTLGNIVNNCYGIFWTSDWNQECAGGGATAAGTFRSTADCTAPQITDEKLEKYRSKGNQTSYDGKDCNYKIHTVNTWYR